MHTKHNRRYPFHRRFKFPRIFESTFSREGDDIPVFIVKGNAQYLFVEISERELEGFVWRLPCFEMEKKGKRIESDSGETPLPEAMIQHVQSYLSGKEAARTTILSKSWHSAWLTRPVLDLDYGNFPPESWPVFEEYAKTTMQRYQGLSLKIERFRLCVNRGCSWAHNFIVNAMNIGATDVELDFPSYVFTLPKEVLGSQTLLRLSVSRCRFDGSFVSCSRLQSLNLKNIKITSDDGFKDIISCCGSIEELSLSDCSGLTLSLENLHMLPKLERLVLKGVNVDSMFFADFASRFPCLKDLTIEYCGGFKRMHIISTSLEIICFTAMKGSWRAKFDVPNVRKFNYSGFVLPSQLSIKGGSREWQLDILISCNRFHKNSWFLNLKKSLKKFRLSRISVSIHIYGRELGSPEHEQEVNIAAVPKPLVLENLMINAPSSLHRALLIRLFGLFRPKFITAKLCSSSDDNASFALCKRLLQELVTPNCAIPDRDVFGNLGLKKVHVFDKAGRLLVLEKPLDPSETRSIMCVLIWD